MSAYSVGQRPHQLEHRLQQVDVDDLAAPGVHGDQGREGGGDARDLVGEGDRRQQRLAVGLAVDRRESRHRLGDRGEPGTLGVRPGLAEAGDAGDHERSLRA